MARAPCRAVRKVRREGDEADPERADTSQLKGCVADASEEEPTKPMNDLRCRKAKEHHTLRKRKPKTRIKPGYQKRADLNRAKKAARPSRASGASFEMQLLVVEEPAHLMYFVVAGAPWQLRPVGYCGLEANPNRVKAKWAHPCRAHAAGAKLEEPDKPAVSSCEKCLEYLVTIAFCAEHEGPFQAPKSEELGKRTPTSPRREGTVVNITVIAIVDILPKEGATTDSIKQARGNAGGPIRSRLACTCFFVWNIATAAVCVGRERLAALHHLEEAKGKGPEGEGGLGWCCGDGAYDTEGHS